MALNMEDYVCEFCGGPCRNIVYAAFVCDDPECLEKARVARGGPGGHMARKAAGKPIIPTELEETARELNTQDRRRRKAPETSFQHSHIGRESKYWLSPAYKQHSATSPCSH